MCKQCYARARYKNNREEMKAAARAWAKANGEKYRASVRAAMYKRTYGITIEQRDACIVAQDGKCKICENRPEKFHTDHYHATGKFRAMLCHHCNHMLGAARDNVEILRKGIEYLLEHTDTHL
jgi:hypothetical protein